MRKYSGIKTKEIIFPLGGIGTGCIGLSGNGRFVDWEIFNHPNKGSVNGYSHIAVRAISEDGTIISKVLCGDVLKDYIGQYSKLQYRGYGFGVLSESMQGFPHFSKWDFVSNFPFAVIHFETDDFPAIVTLTAYNPFIPNEENLSGIPAAFFTVSFTNKTENSYIFSAALSVNRPFSGENTKISILNCNGVLLKSDYSPDSIDYRDMSVVALDGTVQIQPDWYQGGWQDPIVTFWNEFSRNRYLQKRKYDYITQTSCSTVCSELTVNPSESGALRFVLTWNAPNRINDWDLKDGVPFYKGKWKNYYAVLWHNSVDSCSFAIDKWDELEIRSKQFADIYNLNTLPDEVNEVSIRNLCVLKSPTVLRLEDGSLWGWEGLHELAGSCPGSCTHVWNYAYALCFLFPRLERSLRENALRFNLHSNGRMGFRLRLPIGENDRNDKPCVDGQMGEVLKVYREWKISGDDEWLKKMWPMVKKALEYAWVDDGEFSWDADCDGVLEGRQHHTLDMELFGPSGWLEGFYLLALKAAEIMADYLGDDYAQKYRALFEKGSAYTENILFNGQYYIQNINLKDKAILERFNVSDIYWNNETREIKYQISVGCEIDQIVAQWHSNICGLGDIFDKTHRKIALENIYNYNFKSSMRKHTNPWRLFALNDEAGTVMCEYPDETTKPQVPIPYCEECMTGFEYALAGLMLSEGMLEKGLDLIRAVRDRYNGENRNPFNEFECGSNYARSMASWSFIPILSGFEFDMVNKEIGFIPIFYNNNFSCVWSCGGTWGRVQINESCIELSVFGNQLVLKSFVTEKAHNIGKIICDGSKIAFKSNNNKIFFNDKITITKLLLLQF